MFRLNVFRSKADFLTEFGDNFDDRSIELAEKNSNESSPSPSDSSNNVDEISYTAADLVEKPFTCEHTSCHKRFANKFLLKKHQFIHTGLRPHCCPFCGKRFNRKDNLLRHKKTHIANALGTDITSALSSDDFLLRLGADKPTIKLDNEQEEESEI
uniref:C2H2-type domain-containing protein n=2 Tax=Onchocerca TaxID=6281 RepID=A0A8R1XSV1_ONCVO